jgi:hypothetical protein
MNTSSWPGWPQMKPEETGSPDGSGVRVPLGSPSEARESLDRATGRVGPAGTRRLEGPSPRAPLTTEPSWRAARSRSEGYRRRLRRAGERAHIRRGDNRRGFPVLLASVTRTSAWPVLLGGPPGLSAARPIEEAGHGVQGDPATAIDLDGPMKQTRLLVLRAAAGHGGSPHRLAARRRAVPPGTGRDRPRAGPPRSPRPPDAHVSARGLRPLRPEVSPSGGLPRG